MHGVRVELLAQQAAAVGLPLLEVPLPSPCANRDYEEAIGLACQRLLSQGVRFLAFADLFLEDVRRYREEGLATCGLGLLFPLWSLPTAQLAARMVAEGLRARLTCVDPRLLDASFAGREFDAELLAQLPPGVDPCGEHGEFHTFAYAGPMFRHSVQLREGEVVTRDGFVFADLLPVDTAPRALRLGTPASDTGAPL
jgi:diphthamide synthase (EF-2-diphthine--ammonia ligase)